MAINSPCPGKYGSYDQRNDDCPYCEQAFLYQTCVVCEDQPACAGWNRDNGPHCCVHWIEIDNSKN